MPDFFAVRAGMPGGTIRSNQLILRLDPEDDEAEGNQIQRAADAAQPAIEDQLQAQARHIFEGDPDLDELRRRVAEIPEGGFRDALAQMLQETASLGVQATVSKLHGVGIGFNWQLANLRAAEWANTYSYELVHGINETSRRVIGDALAAWVESGEGLEALIAQLESTFGPVRAEMIAVTEATRAYSEGSFAGYEQAGLRRRPPEADRPPAHPRCRCWPGVQQEHDGSWSYVWFTARDEQVCAICGPRHETVIGDAGRI